MTAETREWLSQNTLIGFVEKRGTAWHYREGDDNHFEGPVPPERVKALLDYPLVEAELTATLPGGQGRSIPVTGRKAIVRADTNAVFGIFGQDSYKIHQPREWVYDNLELILDGGLQVGSAVSLKGGAVVSVQAELDETRTFREGVQHRPFLSATTSHDGSLSTRYTLHTQNVVCDNTLAIALGQGAAGAVKIRHSVNSLGRIGEVRENLGFAVEAAGDAFEAELDKLLDEYVSDDRWNEFVKAYTAVETKTEGRGLTMAQNKVGILNRMWFDDPRVAPWKNNAWGVLQAVNTAVHHELPVKGAERAERNMLRTVSDEWQKIGQETLRILAAV